MTVQIIDSHERARGCGFRKEGGLYLREDGPAMSCGKLPLPLTVCPCCSAGIKFSRGWTWINPRALFAARDCHAGANIFTAFALHTGAEPCRLCPISNPPERAGLLWVGAKFYPTPADFCKESDEMGLSRRIHALPRDFKVGETWVLLAHLAAIAAPTPCALDVEVGRDPAPPTPGIFRMFQPSRVEYVVTDKETPEELEALAARGLTLVRVHRVGVDTPLPEIGSPTNAAPTSDAPKGCAVCYWREPAPGSALCVECAADAEAFECYETNDNADDNEHLAIS